MDEYVPQIGDKVRVKDHKFPWMERFIGREGTVAGALTGKSCTVNLKGSLKRWFDNSELELVKRKK